jgi:hypothetical protein
MNTNDLTRETIAVARPVHTALDPPFASALPQRAFALKVFFERVLRDQRPQARASTRWLEEVETDLPVQPLVPVK